MRAAMRIASGIGIWTLLVSAALGQKGEEGGQMPAPPPDAGPQVTPQDAPRPPPDAAVVKFWISIGGKASGPFDLAQIEAKIKAGEISAQTFVLKVGATEWRNAADVAEFKRLLGAVPPAPPQEEKYIAMMVGTWRAGPVELTNSGSQSTWETSFTADGNFSGAQTVDFGYGPTSSPYRGRWKLKLAGQGRISIDFIFQGMGANTRIYTVLNDTTIEDASGLASYKLQ